MNMIFSGEYDPPVPRVCHGAAPLEGRGSASGAAPRHLLQQGLPRVREQRQVPRQWCSSGEWILHTHTQWEWGKGRKTAWKLPIPLDLERKTFINTRRFWTYTDLKTNDKTTKYICLKGCPQTCVLVRILLSHRRRKTKWTVNFGRLEQSVLIKGLWLRLQKKHPVQRLVYKTCDTATSKNGDYDRFYCLSPSDIFHQGSRRWNMSYFVHLSTRWLVRMVWISGIYNC